MNHHAKLCLKRMREMLLTLLKLTRRRIGTCHIYAYCNAPFRDARAILERNLKLNEEGVVDKEPNVYHGQGGYKNYIKKDAAQIGANKYTG